jgi:hypothetical protein
MKSLKLYRGITVAENEVDFVIHDIKTNGLYQNDKQQWDGFIWKNIKKEINTLYKKEDLTLDEIILVQKELEGNVNLFMNRVKKMI